MMRTLQTYLKYIVLTGIFIIPFIHLIVANSYFFPFITGKGFAFRIIVEIIFGAWAILALTHPHYRPKKSWIMWSILAFIAIITLADIFGANPYKSIWSNYERMEGLITLLHLGAYFVIAATVLSTERLWNWFWNTSLAASVIIIFYSFFQIFGLITINQSSTRLDATFGNATYLAVYMLFHVFITAYLVISKRYFLFMPHVNKLKSKLIVGIPLILLQAIILYKTATRGAMLGLIAGILCASVLIVIFERRRPRLKRVALGFIGAVLIVIVGFLAVRQTSFVQNSPVLVRFASISINDKTTISRFILARMAFEGFKERPILGWGQENFNYVFNKYYDPGLYGQEQWFDRTHNVITDWLIAGGALGLLAYLSFYASLLWGIWRKHRGEEYFTIPEKSILTGLLLAYFIHNLFVFDNLISYILFLGVAAYVYRRSIGEVEIRAGERPQVSNRFIAPVALIATILLIYTVNAKPIKANTALIQALQTHVPVDQNNQSLVYGGDATKNLEFFKKVIEYKTLATPEAREQLLTAAERVITSQQAITSRDELVQYAVGQMQEQIKETPDDARYYVLFGSFFNRIGQPQLAIQQFTEAQKLSPGKQTILFELASAYANMEQYTEAEKFMKQAFDLEPNYEQARMLYAASAIYAKHDALVTEILKPLPRKTVVNSDQLIQAYYRTGQTKKVIDLLKERVALSPNDIQNHISLAAGYLLIEDRKNAVAELNKAAEIQPAFRAQADEYIKEIEAGRNP
ncbi:O-antigen ligase family protein [Candidatus Parcubacteria bacterium]|nr:O-antigen ligase family protein [Candidatus Parcubacteria bacterium]